MGIMGLLYIVIATLCASFVGTITGFGTSTIMMPLLAMFIPFEQALLLVGGIHWCTSVWKLVLFGKNIDWKLAVQFGVPAIIMSIVAVQLLGVVKYAQPVLGVFLIGYSVFLLVRPYVYIPYSLYTAIIGGGLSGFLAGLFGVRGAIRSAFLLSFNLPKEVYIATTGAIASVVDTARLIAYFQKGFWLSFHHWLLLLILPPISFIGALLGRIVVVRIDVRVFRVVVILFLCAVGFLMIVGI